MHYFSGGKKSTICLAQSLILLKTKKRNHRVLLTPLFKGKTINFKTSFKKSKQSSASPVFPPTPAAAIAPPPNGQFH